MAFVIAFQFDNSEKCNEFLNYLQNEQGFEGRHDIHHIAKSIRVDCTNYKILGWSEHLDTHTIGMQLGHEPPVNIVVQCKKFQASKEKRVLDIQIDNHNVVLKENNVLEVGCRKVPFETVEKIYNAMKEYNSEL